MDSKRYSQIITYHDPFDQYSIQVPSTWDISSEMTTATCSNRSGSSDCKVISTTFLANIDDKLMYQNMGVGIFMSIIDTPFLSGWFSKRNHILNAKLSGLDAHYDNIFRHYILNTSHAHFQIDIILPVAYERGGFTNSIEIQPPLPPISQEQFDTIQGFIHTFNPTSDENLKY